MAWKWNLDSGPTRQPDGTVTRERFPIKWRRRKAEGKATADATHPPLSAWCAVLLASVAILSIVMLVGWQTLRWAQTGQWPGASLGGLIVVVLPDTPIGAWAVQPVSWIGLHEVVMEVPLVVWILVAWWLLDRLLDY